MAIQSKCTIGTYLSLALAFPVVVTVDDAAAVTKNGHVKASGVIVTPLSLQNDGSGVQKDIKQLRELAKTLIVHTRFITNEQAVLINEIKRWFDWGFAK